MRHRIVRLMLVAAVPVAIAGCGGGGGTSSTTAPATAPPATTAAPTTATTADAGKAIFNNNCAGCHTLANAGATGTVGPNLDSLGPSADTVRNQVQHGGGAMPAFGDDGILTPSEIDQVAQYVSSVAGS